MPNLFLTQEELVELTGVKRKSKQIEVLRRMALPFWVNADGKPVVPVAAIEGAREPVTKSAPKWEPPKPVARIKYN